MTRMPPEETPRAPPPRRAPQAWEDALRGAALLAADPHGLGGAVMRAGPGPLRDLWLEALRRLTPERRWVRLPPHADPAMLTGGLDLAATLQAGAPRRREGLLAGRPLTLVLPMAERLPTSLAAPIAAALDDGRPLLVVALDEGLDRDEAPPAALSERLALRFSLGGLSVRNAAPWAGDAAGIAAARRRLPAVLAPDDLLEALTAAAAAFADPSLRTPRFALRAARAAAALEGRQAPEAEDAALAARLVVAPRARALPAPPEEPEAEDPSPPDQSESSDAEGGDEVDGMEDVVLDAVRAAVPPGLMEMGARPSAGGAGAGAERRGAARGRCIGSRPAKRRSGAGLDLIATLRAAAPWQGLRRQEPCARAEGRLIVRSCDLREAVRIGRSERMIIFVVDASGSAAMERLAEAKGAVESLLAQAYAARDTVALIAFRGTGAQVLLPPTRALARAKRSLAALPGGGGTPLAAGLLAAREMAEAAGRRGVAPSLAVLTDGRANIALDGSAGREGALRDSETCARAIRVMGLPALVIDTALRPGPGGPALAAALGGRCMTLPRGGAGQLGAAVAAVAAGLGG